jgi:curved DNA-binding protein CbpA
VVLSVFGYRVRVFCPWIDLGNLQLVKSLPTMSAYSKSGSASKDLYKILSVSPSSTTQEIKKAYYRIALQSHPDKHNGCSVKLERFKRINEAYDILSNPMKRNEYDLKIGNIYHSNFSNATKTYKRKTPVPKDYRKVYTSRPPPNWKTTWDHAKHYDMHYGNGFRKEAMAQAIRSEQQKGTFTYYSSIGKGFSFDHLKDAQDPDYVEGAKVGATSSYSTNYNPYSKSTTQGPPKFTFDYQEVSNFSGKQEILKHERIVYDLHLRRYKRYVKTAQTNESSTHRTSQNQENEETKAETASSTTDGNPGSCPSGMPKPPSAIYSRYSWTHRQSLVNGTRENQNTLNNEQSVINENAAASGTMGGSACIIM